MKKIKEGIKTALIILLTASAVFLAWRGQLFSAFFSDGLPAASIPPDNTELSFSMAAIPAAAAVTGPGGLCCGVKYDRAAIEDLCEEFGVALAETLGSAEEPEFIGEFTWQDRLQGENLFLDYGFALPISALAAWVGVDADWAGSETGSAFLLDNNGSGNVRLSYRSGDGRCFQCTTAASWASLRTQLEEYRPNGAAFAFEFQTLASCDPSMLVLEHLPAVFAAQKTSAGSEPADVCANLFGINLGGPSRYSEADGTLVYPGDSGVLRLWADGSVTFIASEAYPVISQGTAEQIETARAMLEQIHSAYADEEKLRLSSVDSDAEGTLTLTFSYELNGLMIHMASGPAARVVWKDGSLRELSIRPQRYRAGESAVTMLPEIQAAAAAGSVCDGSATRIVLQDTGEEYCSPVWVVTLNGRTQWIQGD